MMQAPHPNHVAIASCTAYATDAGRQVVEAGGNAFDAAVAAAFNLLVSHPLMCSLGGSGFATVRPAGQEPVVIDFFSVMPGKGLPKERFGQNKRMVEVPYGPGVQIIAGHASIGVPGTAKGLEHLARHYGTLPLGELIQPAARDARQGVPVNPAVAHWLEISAEAHHWSTPYCKELLVTDTGEVPAEGYCLKNTDLALTLELLAEKGSDVLYTGEIGHQIVETVQEEGGLLTMQDLADYDVALRVPVQARVNGYRVYSNPPPSVGGCTLVQLLKVIERRHISQWNPQTWTLFARMIEAALTNRFAFIAEADPEFNQLYQMLEDRTVEETYRAILSSPHTTQVSTVDSLGNACSITMSMGYGSGVAVPGTGIFMDNILGELELNPFGFHGLEPGRRLVSNMSPTVALAENDLIAIGTPGASRITSALAQVLINVILMNRSLGEAIEAPRIHWEEDRVMYEPGITLDPQLIPPEWSTKSFERRHMYFGGVQAARLQEADQLDAQSDCRRGGKPVVASTR